MISEEHEILRTTIREYVQKSIEPEALDIERNGISDEIRKGISAQGFLGAAVEPSLGGSGLDETGYLILLDEVSRASPSAAVDILMINSFFAPVASGSDDGKRALKTVLASGEGITVVMNDLLEGYSKEGNITVSSGKVTGNRSNALNRNASRGVLLTSSDSLVLIEDTSVFSKLDYSLGFRGLGMSNISMNGTSSSTLVGDRGKETLAGLLDGADLPVSAIALGIVSGCLQKGIDYSRVRKTFGQSLKDYQPVAFTLASLKGEEELLRKLLYSGDLSEMDKLTLKIKALDLAKRASKYALQVHGGYGYFEDFGVEKFYRDSTALANLFGRNVKDMERLSGQVYGEKVGFL